MKLDSSLAPSFTPWLAQQFCVPVITFLIIGGTDAVPQSFSLGTRPPPSIENGWAMIVAWGGGFVLALLVNREFPRLAEDGRLIWVLPCILLAMVLSSDLLRAHLLRENNRNMLREYFFPLNEGEDGIPFFLCTVPTYAWVAYSLGVVFGRRYWRKPRIDP